MNMNVKIGKNIFSVKTLIDKKSQSIGMMGKKFSSDKEGLLFLMKGERQKDSLKNISYNKWDTKRANKTD